MPSVLWFHRIVAGRAAYKGYRAYRKEDESLNTKLARRDNYGEKRDPNNIKYLVIHYTSGNGDTAAENATYFSRDFTETSAHYFVDDKEIWQSVPDNYTAWHCGTKNTYYHPDCRNKNSIGIELCSRKNDNGYYFTQQTRERAVRLTKRLMKKYKIPITHILRHYDITHKTCPEPLVRDSYAWSQFKAELEREKEEPMTIYHKLEEVPAWGKETVKFLLEKGYISGDDNGDLDLEHYMLRALVIAFRANSFR